MLKGMEHLKPIASAVVVLDVLDFLWGLGLGDTGALLRTELGVVSLAGESVKTDGRVEIVTGGRVGRTCCCKEIRILRIVPVGLDNGTVYVCLKVLRVGLVYFVVSEF